MSDTREFLQEYMVKNADGDTKGLAQVYATDEPPVPVAKLVVSVTLPRFLKPLPDLTIEELQVIAYVRDRIQADLQEGIKNAAEQQSAGPDAGTTAGPRPEQADAPVPANVVQPVPGGGPDGPRLYQPGVDQPNDA